MKFVCLIAAACFQCIDLVAQVTEDDYASGKEKSSTEDKKTKVPFREKLVFGGGIGGYFGNPTFFQVSPMVGYRTTEKWINGIGFNYMYAQSGGYRQNVYGASLWSRYFIFPSIFLHSELEGLSLNAENDLGAKFHRNLPVWFVGGGYQDSAGRFGLSITLLYDVIQDPYSPYSTPVFRIGGLIGF